MSILYVLPLISVKKATLQNGFAVLYSSRNEYLNFFEMFVSRFCEMKSLIIY